MAANYVILRLGVNDSGPLRTYTPKRYPRTSENVCVVIPS